MKICLLERLRKSLNLSQNDIAERLGVSRPTYVLIEKEEKDITLKQAKILSDLYNIPVESLRTGHVQKVQEQDSVVSVLVPTEYGTFTFGVWNQQKGEETVFLYTPNLDVKKPVLVRIHSECMTGDVFHSYRCDCGEQKDASLRMITESGNGIFIYLRQEGRGIGLHEKIKAYVLQDRGYDTHEANILLGHKPDYREYSWAKKTLEHLGVKVIRLITNNPAKVAEMARLDINVVERVPLVIQSNQHNRRYFETKKQKFKHFFGKEESNYFYQFSYVTSPEQIAEVGDFVATMQKDPFLKICTGVYADAHILHAPQAIKNIEAIFKTAELYEGFVPILHFTFKFSADPLADLALIRERMPCVQYIQLNDISSNHLEVLRHANKFFLVDMPLSDDTFHLVSDPHFVDEIIENKAFVLLDNSHGKGKQDNKINIISKINKLLAKGISDIALYGGFGPDTLDTYFEMREFYKINFSIDAETNLKTGDTLDLERVKRYLRNLISYEHEFRAKLNRSTKEIINSLKFPKKVSINNIALETHPTVFDPEVFFSSRWFAEHVAELIKNETEFIEVGCGTGIISIAAAQANSRLSIHATDINPEARRLTQVNAEKNNVTDRIFAYSGDVLDSIPATVRADTIFWAMPFGFLNPNEEFVGRDTQVFDPGYRAIRKFFATAKNYLKEKGRLLIGFSVDIGHLELLKEIAHENGFSLTLITQTKGIEKESVSMEIWEARGAK